MDIESYVKFVFDTILNLMPKDTLNMYFNSYYVNEGDCYRIVITAPKSDGYNYAKAVNEALAAIGQGRQLSSKEKKNYHFAQKGIEQANKSIGVRTNYEFY